MTSAISLRDVSKHYRGARSHSGLREDIVQGVKRLAGVHRAPHRLVRALDEVTFDIPQGESFALIGENGAGKTTLLKVISRITYPTSGRIEVRGRVGALIEVGTGLHPELSGRENIQLYGRVLGLSGRDIDRRFDGIVEFADIGRAIDQPVKQYSSGMTLRLGFSVAAHVEPDVLLVDEAIAVGDAGFQHRCVERMAELVREGRTLVFVSHDMKAIETLCSRAVRLESGRVADDGPARDVVRRYLLRVQAARFNQGPGGHGVIHGADLDILDVSILDGRGLQAEELEAGESMTVRIRYRAKRRIAGPMFCVGLSDGGPCFSQAATLVDADAPEEISGEGYADCTFESLPLRPRVYEVWGGMAGDLGGNLVDWQQLAMFRIRDAAFGPGKGAVSTMLSEAPVQIPYRWTHHPAEPGLAAIGEAR